jgi:hypothetical protein
MRIGNFEPHPWHLVPVKTGCNKNLGYFGIVVSSFLAIVVLGVIVFAMLAQISH